MEMCINYAVRVKEILELCMCHVKEGFENSYQAISD